MTDFKTGEQLLADLENLRRQIEELKECRARAECRCRKSQERFRSMVETTSDWGWEIDENNRYTYASPRVMDLLGYGAEEVIGKTPFDFMPQEEADRVREAVSGLIARRMPLCLVENVNRRRDGRLVTLETSGVPIFDGEGVFRGYHGIDRDITERKKREQVVMESEERYRRLVDTANEGIWIIAADDRVVFVNEKMAEMIGYAREKMIGRLPPDFLWEEVRYSGDYIGRYHRGTRENLEIKLRRRDGSEMWGLASVTPIFKKDGAYDGALGMVTDITRLKNTERKLEEHRDYLEETVKKRTASLVRANEQLRREIAGRRLVENILRESELRLRRITDNMVDIICQASTDWKIEYVSPSYKTNLGYDPEAMVGRSVFEFVHPDDIGRVIEESQAAVTNGLPGKLEYRYRHADGSYLWLESAGSPLYDLNGKVSGTIFGTRDITDRKRAEESLRESEERYRQMLELSPSAIAVHSEGKIVFINKAGADIYGVRSPEELIGKQVMDFIHPDHRKNTHFRIRHLLEELKKEPLVEEQFIRHDGTAVILEVAAAPINFHGKPSVLVVGRDITERRRSEEALRTSERFLNNIFKSIQDRLSIIDTDFNIIRVNRPVEAAHSHALPLIGKKCYSVYHGQSDICSGCPSILSIKNGEPAHAVVPVRDSDGNINGWLDHCCYPFVDSATGQIKGVLVYARDITEKLKIEQEMARLERMNLVGEMAASIGHEVRNPMTTVRGFLQMLGGKESNPRHREYFELMIDELDRANSIITEFLSLARNKLANMEVGSLNNVLRALSPLILTSAASSNVDVIFETGEIPDLPLNEKEIRQLILNLVRNGIESMDRGGNLAIRTFSDRGKAVLAVQDQGPGIPPGVIEKIGTPFFTTKEMGTGLGLAVCYGIAARHNAAITIDTGPAGSTFFVAFNTGK